MRIIAAIKSPIPFCAIVLTLSLNALSAMYAGNATWRLSPLSGDWNTAANWMPRTVPDGPADVATFGVSNTTDVSMSVNTRVSDIVFNSGADAFTITANP